MEDTGSRERRRRQCGSAATRLHARSSYRLRRDLGNPQAKRVSERREVTVVVMSYAASALSHLIACPFCREMFQAGEARACPTCGLALSPVSKLPPSYEVMMEDDWPQEPEWATLPLGYWRRGRGALALLGLAGAGCFFLPWAHVRVPEIETLSGYEIARALGWVWGSLVGWGTLVATVMSRRSVAKMRGARVAAALFCAIPLLTTSILLAFPPRGGIVPVRFDYGVGIYATFALSLIGLPFAIFFGGKLDDLPAPKGTSKGEGLH